MEADKIRCKECKLLTAESVLEHLFSGQIPGTWYKGRYGCLKDLLSSSLAFLINDLNDLHYRFL